MAGRSGVRPRAMSLSDVFIAVCLCLITLVVFALYNTWMPWIVPVGVVALWYAFVAHPAMRLPSGRLAVVFGVGIVALQFWASTANTMLSLLAALATVIVQWIFARRLAIAYTLTVLVMAANAGGQMVYVHTHPDEIWSVSRMVVEFAVLPVMAIVITVLIVTWGRILLKWGHDRRELVDDLRDTQRARIDSEREAAVAEERLRMAREVQDTIAQDVAGLRYLVEQARRQVDVIELARPDALLSSTHPRPFPRTVDLICDAVDTVSTQTRVLVAARTPVPLDSSFKVAVERIITRFHDETGIVIDPDITDVHLSREAEVVFVRCLQEGLSNVRKHAAATRVKVTIAVVSGAVVMTLTDNGVGMSAAIGRGLGLPGMAERVRLAGGTFSIESPGPSLGVTMRVRMPADPR